MHLLDERILSSLAGTDDSVVSEDRLNETELTDLEGQQESPPKTYLSAEEEKIMAHSQSDGLHTIHEHEVHAASRNHHDEDKAALRKHNHQWPHKHAHHSHGPCHSGSDLRETGIANIAWMVIMGDGIHNFSDGLAIGKRGGAQVYNVLPYMTAVCFSHWEVKDEFWLFFCR